jgi:Na+/H+-dicarboxylate symporter
MELITGLLVIGHAVLAILFFCGLVGRGIVLALSERADTIAAMRTLAKAAAPFEWLVIRVGSIALLLGVAVAVAQGRPFLGPLQGGHVDWLFTSTLLLLTVAPLPPLVFLPRGRVFEAALADATERGQVTPELRAAWRDPFTRAAHVWELVVVTTVLVLMIAKPF